MDALGEMELLLIDEISTVGAAQVEMMSRRFEQVKKVMWCQLRGTEPPESFGGFGSIGMVCMGTFAQLPLVLATSLLPEARLTETRSPGLRSRGLQGCFGFQGFVQVIRSRHTLYIQKGAAPYKDSTIR